MRKTKETLWRAGSTLILATILAIAGLSSCMQELNLKDVTTSSTARSTVDPDTYDGVVIFYKGSAAPSIWVWEKTGNAISALMGYTWNTQPLMTADSAHPGWYYFAIPAARLSGKNLVLKFNRGGDIERGSALTGWYDSASATWSNEGPDQNDDEEEQAGVTIYYKGASAPSLWAWELNANALSALMGYTWNTQPLMTADSVHPGWYSFEIPAQYLSGAKLMMKFNRGGDVARGSALTGWYDSASSTWYDTCPDQDDDDDDEEITDLTLYYRAASAPSIWLWELNANALTALMGYSWTTQPLMTAVDGYTGWYSFTVPSRHLTGAKLIMKINSGADIARGSGSGGWYDPLTALWSLECPDQPTAPTIKVSPENGVYRGAAEISIAVKSSMVPLLSCNASFNGQNIPLSSGSASALLSAYVSDGATGILSVTGTNEVGTTSALYYLSRDDSITKTFSWDNALVYFVMTDRFANGNTANDASYGRTNNYGGALSSVINTATFHGGDIAGLTAKLNEGYFTDLGVNAIWITAPYEQIHGFVGGGYANGSAAYPHYGYHGYYTLDWTMMDKNMGTVEEFRAFVKTAHSQGIRVIMDVVINHTGYENLVDAAQYGYGNTGVSLAAAKAWKPSGGLGGNWDELNNLFTGNWGTWLGSAWVRSKHYSNTSGGDLLLNVGELPDLKTELTASVGVPPLLQTKWAGETSGYNDWIVPSAVALRADIGVAPGDYLIKWLASWVAEFGIDGFRCDTAKHVDMFRWDQLKTESDAALKAWRASSRSADDDARDWTENFWMTGEVWGHGVGRSSYFDNGFDSIINFTFPKAASVSAIGSVWAGYASTLNNGNDGFNVLSYLNSHDARENYGWVTTGIDSGTCLLLAPGGVQIYYGDEVVRPLAGDLTNDKNQSSRSDYLWNSQNVTVLSHWQKIGQFRNRHLSVGGGSQTTLAANVYGRTLTDSGVTDRVVIAISQSGTVAVPVNGFFSAGSTVRNSYTGSTAVVSNALTATFTASNGVILIEATE